MKNILFTVLLNIPLLTTYSQRIVVRNISTGETIENVAIYNQDKSISTITDNRGRANIDKFNNKDTIFFQHPSYVNFFLPRKQAPRDKQIFLERKIIILPEFVVSASKHRENKREIAYFVDVLSPRKLANLPSQNSADILLSTGSIFIQKSQVGGGSPVLRGFEANKVLLVVDGIRMNNAIYRGGHLQNALSIDNASLHRTEIIFGPSSVIYGSDALGGVIHYITKNPKFADSLNQFKLKTNAYAQVASATNSIKSHFDFNFGWNKVASLTSLTHSSFNDLRTGGKRNPLFNDWGKQLKYVAQFNGIDSVIDNTNKLYVPNSGYQQIDLLQKVKFKTSSKSNLLFNFQLSNTTNLNRHDELNNEINGIPEFAEWYYGPQKRILGSARAMVGGRDGLFSNFVSIIGYQDIEESRNTRLFRTDTLIKQIEKVKVFSANFDLVKFFDNNSSLYYGLESNQNIVSSEAYKENTSTNEEIATLTRYPDKGATTLNIGAYLSYKTHLNDKFILSLGSRYQYYTLNANYGELFYDMPSVFRGVNLTNNSVTGSLSIIYNQTKTLKWSTLLSSGFRNPNLDDIAKIRLSSGKLTLPNANLRHEKTYNIEFGVSKTFDGYIMINANYFLTSLDDAIVRQPYTFSDGSDSLFFMNKYRSTYVNVNSDKAVIHGFNISMISDLNANISFKSTLNYTYGKDLSNNEPLAHISPVFGRTNFTYEIKRFMAEVYFNYAGWKKLEDMALSGEDKHDEGIEEFGFPGWYTINVNSSFKISNKIILLFAVENLTDNFYQPFASGTPAPGINFIGTLKLTL